MNKGRIKTLILIGLVSSSLLLTKQIWFSEKLWSEDYNFFARWRNNPLIMILNNKISKTTTFQLKNKISQEQLLNPQRIVVNDGGVKVIYKQHMSQYTQYNNLLKDVYTNLLRSKQERQYQEVTEQEWFDVLRSKSFYFFIDFGSASNTQLLEKILNAQNSSLSGHVKSIKESIIIPGYSISDDILLYIKDFSNNAIYKFDIKYDKNTLNSLIKTADHSNLTRYTFSFEQEFDKPKATSKVIIDSHILMPRDTQYLPVIRSSNPLDIENERQIEDILEAFNYNTRTFRQYREPDGTQMYVENDSKLKIYPEGLIEYTAIEKGKGLEVAEVVLDEEGVAANNKKEAGIPSLYQSLNLVTAFMNQVGLMNESLHITSDIIENPNKPGEYTFTFDYFQEGYPVKVNLDNRKMFPEEEFHAVKVIMINGKIQYYRQYVRDYQRVDDVEINISMLRAIEQAYATVNHLQTKVKFEDVTLSYIDEGYSSIQYPQWYFKFHTFDGYSTLYVPAID